MQNDFASQTLQILEIIGTVAFGASGLIAAARKRLDMVGVVLLVLVTAFGGGTLRDLLLNRHPFFWMTNEIWIWVLAALAIGPSSSSKPRTLNFQPKPSTGQTPSVSEYSQPQAPKSLSIFTTRRSSPPSWA